MTFDGVGKVYPDGTHAVSDMTLRIDNGEFMVLVGPSGCGKTTALRMVAGLEEISEGVLYIGDRVVNRLPARDRDIAMVFQSYALYPHLTVHDNIAFSLRLRKMPKDEVDARVREAARVLGLEEHLDRKPRALSGGQRQRVAMGRAIVRQPQAYLMDEPLSNLDAKLRVHMRAEISSLQGELGVTTIYVTHDQVEAMTMGDRVAVMRKGELQQVAPPQELYERPVNLFVGGFIGSPAMNMVEASIERQNGKLVALVGRHALALDEQRLPRDPGSSHTSGAESSSAFAPRTSRMPPSSPIRRATSACRASSSFASRSAPRSWLTSRSTRRPPVTEDVRELARDVGQERAVQAAAEEGTSETTLVGRFGPRSRIKSGEVVDVAVETGALHFFDLETGLGIYDKAATT